jgi:hypothetical protein
MVRSSKDDLYKDQQKQLLLKILEDIGITNENKIIRRIELESDEFNEKINRIYEDIKKYYKTSSWNSTKYGTNREMNILKNMCKYHSIVIDKIQKKRNVDGKYVNDVHYKFDIPETF